MIAHHHYRAGTRANALPGFRGLMGEMENLADGLMVPGGACWVAIPSRDACIQEGSLAEAGRTWWRGVQREEVGFS